VLILDLFLPFLAKRITVIRGERSTVGHEGSCHNAVTIEARFLQIVVLQFEDPICLLFSQAADEFLSTINLGLESTKGRLEFVHLCSLSINCTCQNS